MRLAELPVAPGVEAVARDLGIPGWRLAAGGGEDYELCFCADPRDREQVEAALAALGTVEVSWVGEVVPGGPGVLLSDERGDAVRIEGFEHRW